MSDKKNVTYLLGAGASYNSVPILKEFGERMLFMAKRYLSLKGIGDHTWKPGISKDPIENMRNIGYWGELSRNYGTIDTIAKYLFLNNSVELKSLKFAVSFFLTIWETSKEPHLRKIEPNNPKSESYSEIDGRYISLLAALLPDDKLAEFKINQNVKFVTWNYDLQLQRAYKLFRPAIEDFETATENLKYKLSENLKKPDICHLNGYSGYYHMPNNTGKKELHFLERHKTEDLVEIIEAITEELGDSLMHEEILIDGHINYAWESEGLNGNNIIAACNIFRETDYLIIIGYSFPNFNKSVDKKLFDNLDYNNRAIKIYYQDPNQDETIIKELTKSRHKNYTPVENLDKFFLPYDF